MSAVSDPIDDRVVEERLKITAWLIPEDGHWVALAADFDVVGMGATPKAALRNMEELLEDYLSVVLEDGDSLRKALRPISRRRQLRLEAARLRGNLRSRLKRERSVHRVVVPRPC